MNAPNEHGNAEDNLGDGSRAQEAIEAADAAAAYHVASDMEEPLREILRAASAIRVIADGAMGDKYVQEALYFVVGALDEVIEKALEMQTDITHKTWAYAHAPDIVVTERKEKEPVKEFHPAVGNAVTALIGNFANGTPISKKIVKDLAAFQAQAAKGARRPKTKKAA